MKKMSADLESKKYESALLVASYERKIAELKANQAKAKEDLQKRQIGRAHV